MEMDCGGKLVVRIETIDGRVEALTLSMGGRLGRA
jgi:hypothetical protein